MNITDKFWKQLDQAIAKSIQYKVHYFQGIKFRDYSKEENQKIFDTVNESFSTIIDQRDLAGIDRYKTAMDCAGMSILIHNLLSSLNIPSVIMIGDILFDGEHEYNTSYDYIENEIQGVKSEKVHYHVWVLAENFMLIDPTIHMKESDRSDFMSKESKSKPFICDVENLPKGIEYIPFILGEKFLKDTNFY